MNYKYIILDFGNVLAKPITGDWFITPKFLELIDMNLIDKNKLVESIVRNNDIVSRRMLREDDEYHHFYEFYLTLLCELNYPKYSEDIVHEIAYNFAYESDKYTFYEGVREELSELRKKYRLIMLTDNWPCVEKILNDNKLTKYFEKVYISSYYEARKKDGIFFEYPIKDFKIKPHEALFIDDYEVNLDKAVEYNLDVLLMDREDEVTDSKYTKIKNLKI